MLKKYIFIVVATFVSGYKNSEKGHKYLNSKYNLTRNFFKKILVFLLVVLNFRFVNAWYDLPANIVGMFSSDRDLLIRTNVESNERFFVAKLHKPYDLEKSRDCIIRIQNTGVPVLIFADQSMATSVVEKSEEELSEELGLNKSINTDISSIHPIEGDANATFAFFEEDTSSSSFIGLDAITMKDQNKPEGLKDISSIHPVEEDTNTTFDFLNKVSTNVSKVKKAGLYKPKKREKSCVSKYKVNISKNYELKLLKVLRNIKTFAESLVSKGVPSDCIGMQLYDYFSTTMNDPVAIPMCQVDPGEPGDPWDILSDLQNTDYVVNQVIWNILYDNIDKINMEKIIINKYGQYPNLAEILFYFFDFVIRLTTPNMNERMTARQALNHQFLNIKF